MPLGRAEMSNSAYRDVDSRVVSGMFGRKMESWEEARRSFQ